MAKQNRKTLQELDLSDDFLFAKVMENEEVCRELLQKILGVTIRKVETVVPQKTIDPDYLSKGIRLDVYLADSENTVYSVEMQKENEHNIPRRSRYYQGMMDLDMLAKGADYCQLKRNVIIFICTFDYFQRGLHRYTFENCCREDQELLFEDDTLKIVLNTRGKADDVETELLEFLQYVEHSDDSMASGAQGKLVKLIHEQVCRVKANKELEMEYMKLWERDQKNLEEGRRQGMEEGMEKGMEKMALESAKKLKALGIDPKIISAATGLTLEQVDQLE